ncbi:MAG: hypothetical protein P8X89_16120 [Reinekea sp.]
MAEWTYDSQDRKISQTVAVGSAEEATTTYGWNDTYNQIEKIMTDSEVTLYSFDTDGNRTATTVTPVQ